MNGKFLFRAILIVFIQIKGAFTRAIFQCVFPLYKLIPTGQEMLGSDVKL